jgi:thiamine pyrophosphokinase
MPAEEAVETVNPSRHRTVIFTGGSLTATPHVEPTDFIIAADSGYDLAIDRDVLPELLVGDLDSISPEGLADARHRGVEINRFPRDKDASDLELALRVALDMGSNDVVLYGGESGRIDHFLAVALSITSREWSDLTIVWHTASGSVHPLLPGRTLELETEHDATVSLVPIGDVAGIRGTGLRWTLSDDALNRGTTRGISNICQTPPCTVSIAAGALLVIVGKQED